MKLFTYNLAGALALAVTGSLHAAPPSGRAQQPTSPDQVPEGLAKSDWQSIRAAYEAGRHAFQPSATGWQARNPGQQWTTKFDGRGFVAEPCQGGWQWGLELKSYGFPGAERVIGEVSMVKAEGQRLTYDWDAAVQEWFVNDARGLEHGFTVKERPPAALNSQPATLSFLLATRGPLRPNVTADAQGVEFQDASGATVLNYSGLKVWDADGKVLASRFEAVGEAGVRLLVDESAARYPLTIDPLAQQAYLKAHQVNADDWFGFSVAVSGDTVVVGASREASSTTGINSTPNNLMYGAGAAYVFVRSGTNWTQQAYLKAHQVNADDYFGTSVAVAGDTVVVGAYGEDSSTTGVNSTPNESAGDAGAAYVFVRSGTNWTQQAYLKAHQVNEYDFFGYSVAVVGNRAVVGAFLEGSSTTGVNSTPNESAFGAGAAYVFLRSGTNWTQQAYLKAHQVTAGDYFGTSVAMVGDTVVVGASREDSGTTGVNTTPNENSTDAGAAYVFVRSGANWTQQAYLKAHQVNVSDYFGVSVAVSGDTVVVGAYFEDSSTTGVNSTPNESALGAGAVFVFVRSGTNWTQQAYLKAHQVTAGDYFGQSVAVAGDTVVVGATGEGSSTTGVNSTPNEDVPGAGAAYVFVRNETNWMQQAYLKAHQVNGGDNFGYSVAVSGDTVVVGAPGEDSSTTGVNSTPNENRSDAGAAYVFEGYPEIAVEQPAGTNLTAGAASVGFGGLLPGSPSPAKVFTIRNLGLHDFTLSAPAVTGGNAGDFSVDTTGTLLALVPGQQTAFSVTFTPAVGGASATTLRIVNDDADENPFDIALNGTGLVTTNDTDGDGLNDLAEFNLSALGFDWEVSQPALVNTLFGNIGDAQTNLNAVGYFTAAQVQALNVGTPLLTKNATNGTFTLTIGVQKATQLTNFVAFPMNSPGFTNSINAEGKLEFQFTIPDNAAFFRLQSQ